MKKRFWLFKRAGVFYLQDVETRKKESLHTTDRQEAERLREARNEAAYRPHLGFALAKAYLSAYDPAMIERSWEAVIAELSSRGKPTTQHRKERAFCSGCFDSIRHKKLLETTAADFFQVIGTGGVATNHFLRCLHNLALGLGWLPFPIIPPKLWPKARMKPKRGITWEEHQIIVASEQNLERKQFYQLLWEIGASQTDTVMLSIENIDWKRKILAYQRQKTGQWAHLKIGLRLEALLQELPHEGPLFPKLRTTTDSARAAEFYRRCHVAGVIGVSLHSYRYSWAQRARALGCPERWAEAYLGHNMAAMHYYYARGGYVDCPALDNFEHRINPAKDSRAAA